MRSLTVVAADTAVEERLLELYTDQLAVRRVWSDEWREPRVAVMEICAANPSIVVLAGLDEPDADMLVTAIDRRDPGIGVVVLLEHRSPDSVMSLLRAGAREVLDVTAPDSELRGSIDSVLSLVAERQRGLSERSSGPPRRVVVVAGPKGGSGKTTISTNLAAGAARRYPGYVLLIDLDTLFGDVSSALGVDPQASIADACQVGAHERTALKVFLTMHDSGLAVLAAPEDFAKASNLADDDIKRTLAALIEEYPMVIIDTAAGIDEASLVSMEFASDVIFVASPDVPAVRAVKRQLDALDDIGLRGPRRHLVINRADSRVGLSTDDIEETIGLESQFRIPSSRQVPVSTNEGIPLVIGDRRDKAKKPLEDMIDFFAPDTSGEGRLTGWLKRRSA